MTKIDRIISLEEITDKLEPRDFKGFADEARKLSEPLAAVIEMHAEAAAGNSPDVQKWVDTTADEWAKVESMSEDQAKEWWLKEYV